MSRPRARQRSERRARPDPWAGPYTALPVLPADLPTANTTAADEGALSEQPPPPGSGLEFARAPSGDFRFRPAATRGRVWPVAWCAFLHELDTAGGGGGGSGVAALFRALIRRLETRDYHMRAVPCEDGGFYIECRVSGDGGSGPVDAHRCMSCDLATLLCTGLLGDSVPDGGADGDGEAGEAGCKMPPLDLTSADTLLYEEGDEERSVGDDGDGYGGGALKGVRVWMDAKARSMFVVTPRRHIESMADMTNEELRDLWMGCAAVVRREGLTPEAVLAMICNSGRRMNHAHLHVKLKIDSAVFNECRKRWSAQRQRRWDRLAAFAVEAARPRIKFVLAKARESITTVYVGDLDCVDRPGGVGAVEGLLRERCAEFGDVRSCKVLPHRKCAYVEFASHAEAGKCIVGMYRRISFGSSQQMPYYDWARR
jgi:RNA recognition motif. (a.k.a. RRM, RBD, or RNP domain)/HIT domain